MAEKRLAPEQMPSVDSESLEFVGDVLQLYVDEGGGLTKGPYGVAIQPKDSGGLGTDTYGAFIVLPTISGMVTGPQGLYVDTRIGSGLGIGLSGVAIVLDVSSGLAIGIGGIKVDALSTGGLKADGTGMYIKLPSNVSGLNTDATGLYINLPGGDDGLEFDGTGHLKGTLAAAGVMGGVKPPNTGAGKFLSEAGTWTVPAGGGVTLDPGGGLEIGGFGLKVKPDYTDNMTLAITGDGLVVAYELDGGITAIAGEGLMIKSDPNGGTISTNDGLKVKLPVNASGLILDGTGLAVNPTLPGAPFNGCLEIHVDGTLDCKSVGSANKGACPALPADANLFLNGNGGWTAPPGGSGAQGPQGWQGAQGFQGWQGWQGDEGSQGPQGDEGTQGLQGNPGVGNQGPIGFQGFQGWQGYQGYQGRQGYQGWQGPGTVTDVTGTDPVASSGGTTPDISLKLETGGGLALNMSGELYVVWQADP